MATWFHIKKQSQMLNIFFLHRLYVKIHKGTVSTDLVMGAAKRKYLCIHPVHSVVPHMQMKQFETI